jgi:hypothetical protein
MRIINKSNYVEGQPLADPQWLPVMGSAVNAYNCRQHSSHGHQPFFVFRGRHPYIENAVAQDEHTDETLAARAQMRQEYFQHFEDKVRYCTHPT